MPQWNCLLGLLEPPTGKAVDYADCRERQSRGWIGMLLVIDIQLFGEGDTVELIMLVILFA